MVVKGLKGSLLIIIFRFFEDKKFEDLKLKEKIKYLENICYRFKDINLNGNELKDVLNV